MGMQYFIHIAGLLMVASLGGIAVAYALLSIKHAQTDRERHGFFLFGASVIVATITLSYLLAPQ